MMSNVSAPPWRLELSWQVKPGANSSWHNTRIMACGVQSTVFATIQPSPNRRNLSMSGGALRPSGKFSTHSDTRIPRTMMTLSRPSGILVSGKKNSTMFPAFKLVLAGHEHSFTLVQKSYVTRGGFGTHCSQSHD